MWPAQFLWPAPIFWMANYMKLKKNLEKKLTRPGIDPETSGLSVRCCTTEPSVTVENFEFVIKLLFKKATAMLCCTTQKFNMEHVYEI